MKPMLDQAFWSDPDIEAQKAVVKLAALWLITNSRTSIIGVCGATPQRFEFETGLPAKSLEAAIVALPRAFKRFGGVVFVINYIRHQFGSGEKLTKNNFFVSLKSQVAGIKDADLAAFILEEYPEFEMEIASICKSKRDHVVAPGLRKQIFERDGYVCLFSGEKLPEDELDADHVISRSKGGRTTSENLMTVSKVLNVKKNDKDLADFCREMNFDFAAISKTIQARASKPLLGLSKPKDSKGKEGEGEERADPEGKKPPRISPTVKNSPHGEFIHRWTEAYPAHHGGEEYAFAGAKDGAAVTALLARSKLTPTELMEWAIEAWQRPADFNCKSAAAITGFASRFNEIRAELRAHRDRGKPETPAAFAAPMNKPPERPDHAK